MSFTFDPNHMFQDLWALSRGASTFLRRQSAERLQRLATDLQNAIANAKASGRLDFLWTTQGNAPIQIKESKWWKGDTENFKEIEADIRLDYKCLYIPDAERVQANGATIVTIRDVAGGGVKVVHFDVEIGGWNELSDGRLLNRAGHPPFHAQFHGMVNDIPRMPSLIVHPVDVLSFVILELHQKRWRAHIDTLSGKTQLRLFPPRQRTRLVFTMQSWMAAIERSDFHALVSMQRPFASPLSL